MKFLLCTFAILLSGCSTFIGELSPEPQLKLVKAFSEQPAIVFGEQIIDEVQVMVPAGQKKVFVKNWKTSLKNGVGNSLKSIKLAAGAQPSSVRLKFVRTDLDLTKVITKELTYFQIDLRYKVVLEGVKPNDKSDEREVWESIASAKMKKVNSDTITLATQKSLEKMFEDVITKYLQLIK